MLRIGKITRRLKRLLWRLHQPAWSEVCGVVLPSRHTLVTPGIGREVYLGDYESKEIEIISKRLDKEDIVLEVGAGLGFLSSYCARHIGSDRVFAYEANLELIPLINETYSRNNVRPTLKNAMLGPVEGTREFGLEAEFWASSAHRPSGRTISVRQLNVNSELVSIRPTFLIVDIEGGESEFFASADLSSVTKICVETHPDVLGDAVLSEMLAGLINKGFSIDFSLIRKNVFFLRRRTEPKRTRQEAPPG